MISPTESQLKLPLQTHKTWTANFPWTSPYQIINGHQRLPKDNLGDQIILIAIGLMATGWFSNVSADLELGGMEAGLDLVVMIHSENSV